jgi:hypothetical protein
MKTLRVSISIVVGVLTLALLGVTLFLQTSPPDSAYRCAEMSRRFVDEMRKRDRESAVHPDRRASTYRSHYNFVEQKCFVQADTTIMVLGDRRVTYLSQVWDVDAGIRATAYARKSREVSLIPNSDELILYSSDHSPKNVPAEEWFTSLMAQ